MRKDFLMCLAAVLLTAGVASAVTWTCTDPNSIARGYGYWNVAANWTGGLPTASNVATFNAANKPVCWVTDTRPCGRLELGVGAGPCFLTVKNGGRLSLGNLNGYNSVGRDNIGTLTIEKGGIVTSTCRIEVGRRNLDNGAPSYVNVDGGTLELTAGNLQIGYGAPDGWGKLRVDNNGLVNVRAGTITNDNQNSTPNKMLVDVGFGTIILNGDQTTFLTTWKTLNQLVAFGGKGTLVWDYNVTNALKTTLTATHPMTPVPAYGSMIAEGTVALGWTNMAPIAPATDVYVDVWFGTDPNKLNPLVYSQKVTAGMNTVTVNVPAPVVGTAPTTYYWQVDSYLNGSPTGTPIAGDVFKFDVTNDFPPTVVIDTPNMVTWGDPNQSVPVQLNATVSDTGSSALTIAWTSSPAGAVFTPSAAVEDPAVTMTPATFPTTYTLTCSVKDAVNPTLVDTDTVQVVVYANACAVARRPNAPGIPPTDLDGDCDTDLDDMYVALLDWTRDYTLLVPTVIP